ncbi:MAG: hypothetical protein RMJ56_06570 [Gemmataceae bacterium]|nr:hypothetical protein [Gemmata sp.]MDW8197254.1 hypothetical protein [Gemmataceae bacterium]
MRVRSWLIRGLILAGVAAIVALAWLANSWVSPERVRAQVIQTLAAQFEDVEIHVGSARLRILGGIAVTDLRLGRRGDPPDQPLLVVPQAILYHDKEKLNHGHLVIRKVELESPTLRVERSPSGRWNWADVMKPGPADRPIPSFVIKNGTLALIDHTSGALPAITFTEVQGTLVNDPLPTLTVQGAAVTATYGAVSWRGRFHRLTHHLALSVEVSALPLGETALAMAARYAPELVPHLDKLTATAKVRADLTYTPETGAWRHKVTLHVTDARFEHPDLPWPLENITATVQSENGFISVDRATARIGAAKVTLSLETRPDLPAASRTSSGHLAAGTTPTDDPLRKLENNLQRLEVTATDIPLRDSLFERLPDKLQRVRRMFNPTGVVDVSYKFHRDGAGWRRELEVRPKQVGMMYEKFRYPVADVRGVVKKLNTHTGSETITLNLVGSAAGQLITVTGTIDGDGDDPAININVAGSNMPLDEQVYAALPVKYAAMVRKFNATARGDFLVKITQPHGVNLCENEIRIDVKDGHLHYSEFPYTLQKLKGRLVIRTTMTDPARPLRPGEPRQPLPDRDEILFDHFTALHGAAPVWMHGSKRIAPNGHDHVVVLHIGGTMVPLDDELKKALATVRIDEWWDALAPRGHITFEADVEVIDRAPDPRTPQRIPPLDPANDIQLSLKFSGPTITPTFFPYELTETSGVLDYHKNRLQFTHLAGRHGTSRVKLAAGEVRFFPQGMVWANLGGLEAKPLVVDEALVKALPGKLGPAVAELQLQGPMELLVKHLVVLSPPEAPAAAVPNPPALGPVAATSEPRPDPVVYWDGELRFLGASFDTGIAWEEVVGAWACRGRYEGTHLGAVRGNVWLERATVSGVPVKALTCQLKTEAQLPDPARPGQYLPPTLQFLQATGDVFSGALVGQARVVPTTPPRYEVWLTLTDAKLEEVAKHYKLGSDADLSGIAQAQLLVYNRCDPKTGQWLVEGAGKIDVPHGRMYNLPIILDLVKVLKLQTPDKTAFEQAHAVFRLQGDRIKVDQLDLVGKAICVGGSGELDTQGDYVKFDFYTIWSKVLHEMNPLGDITAFLSKNLFTIKLVRENGELKYKPEPVPLVTEPAKAVVNRLKRGVGQLMGRQAPSR